ncbi:HAMP domain-containing histidine kinase [Candidatus Woesearchaeota archaeon]|jgi:signal transduction histidine kinase|nr:HAMP domain-containing histidine kinase [Candidatus Woesearchaeota archaeon]MBT5272689.1 HAMP domain-containing histidine kinase [Candidatus Woesearchaeota archaeon]MBT6337066.1 HAMP domain-containing histidine kinase [Candidatus Woesearchaeota archaeon]MBT7927880.1 HAMP domain-containing histidine kinase [Candidatus Woesearchaeota archaeon]
MNDLATILLSVWNIFLVLTIQVFNKISLFFSTTDGELLKSLVEFIIFTVISYMLISEFRKSRKQELKYLIFGFFSLMISRLIITIAFTYIAFTNITVPNVEVFLPIIDNTLEIIALLLVANAFLYPLHKKKLEGFKSNIFIQIIGFLIITSLIQLYWLSVHTHVGFRQSLGFFFYEALKFLVFIYPIFSINTKKHRKITGRYANSIIFAFMLFLVSPIINLLNYLMYGGSSQALIIMEHPFPLLSMLFFMRVVFLKLVDKATLREQLSKTKQKYEHQKELAKLKDEFVSTVSHELRTPLTNIKLYLSLLLSGEFGKLGKKQKEPLIIVKSEGERLNNLINDILSLAKLEAKKQKLKLSQIKLHEIVDKTVYHQMAKKKGIKIINKIPKNLIVNIDENLFKQVIINLFSNALKFTEKSGKIIFNAKKQKKGFEFSIQDTGKGIEKGKLPYLFDKFYQAENYMTREKGGTGLGLAIVKKIIELHSGVIDVESDIGEGTKFTVFLP